MSIYNYIFASKAVLEQFNDVESIEEVDALELNKEAKFYQYDDRLNSPENILDAFIGQEDYIRISKENFDFLQRQIQEQ